MRRSHGHRLGTGGPPAITVTGGASRTPGGPRADGDVRRTQLSGYASLYGRRERFRMDARPLLELPGASLMFPSKARSRDVPDAMKERGLRSS